MSLSGPSYGYDDVIQLLLVAIATLPWVTRCVPGQAIDANRLPDESVGRFWNG